MSSSNRSRTLLKGSLIKEDSPEDGLYSLEKLRTSPELWPEKIPGISNFIAMSDTPIRTPVPQWSKDLSQEDINAMIQLSNMPFSNLIMEIKKMYDEAYQLGVSEAKEMTRGKYLGIFNNAKKKSI
ncbi:protein lin-52 homolog [Bactrocera neohumeralis]|uniref:protein lin-52 homolog n=1 Tax=Bactrocera tryoni TaxID=59916 RepID=UPI001A99E918|nr:protein lin-52 homolog [Bactrocera tryoni]XP_050328159.1 protein lin-52 homolog [Bactrocera neohumeralis]